MKRQIELITEEYWQIIQPDDDYFGVKGRGVVHEEAYKNSDEQRVKLQIFCNNLNKDIGFGANYRLEKVDKILSKKITFLE